jgi:cytosine/adenosine deaminase-related metal-dependent hydrolase
MKHFSIRRLTLRLSVLGLLTSAGFLSFCSKPVPAKLLVTNATVLTMQEGKPEPFVGYLLVGADGKIAQVGAGSPPAGLAVTQTVDGTGKIIIPGFISAHSHIWQSAHRGTGANSTIKKWAEVWFPYAQEATPEDYYWYTLHGSADFLKYGVTSAYDFTFPGVTFSGYEAKREQLPGDYEGEQFKAHIDAGLRFIHSFSLSPNLTEDEQATRIQKFITFTDSYKSNPLFLKLAISGGTAYSPTKDLTIQEVHLMKKFGLDNQSHLLEPPDGLNQRDKFYWMKEAGMLGPSLYFGHFIHTTPEIVAEAAKAGCGMVWNAMSNGRLASGFADVPAYLKAGMKVGMGLDDQNACDIPDPFENMRVGLYSMRAKYESTLIMKPYDVLKLHTLGSATVMRVADKVGSLEPGKFADFLIIDPLERDIGPVNDIYACVVLACGQMNLQSVYVGGDLVCDRGQLTHQNFDKISQEVHTRAAAAKARAKEKLKAKLSS